MEISRAKEIMGNNFIGINELSRIKDEFPLDVPEKSPSIKYSEEKLSKVKDDHLLVLCVENFANGDVINIKNIRKFIQQKEIPCFYNQDWYLNEEFIYKPLKYEWCLVAKKILEKSRGLFPTDVNKNYKLFSAIELTYVFFVFYFYSQGGKLWNNDYVWCSDKDDKGDQIYVGRYSDASGANADGFEIHRHLKIKNNYGAV